MNPSRSVENFIFKSERFRLVLKILFFLLFLVMAVLMIAAHVMILGLSIDLYSNGPTFLVSQLHSFLMINSGGQEFITEDRLTGVAIDLKSFDWYEVAIYSVMGAAAILIVINLAGLLGAFLWKSCGILLVFSTFNVIAVLAVSLVFVTFVVFPYTENLPITRGLFREHLMAYLNRSMTSQGRSGFSQEGSREMGDMDETFMDLDERLEHLMWDFIHLEQGCCSFWDAVDILDDIDVHNIELYLTDIPDNEPEEIVDDWVDMDHLTEAPSAFESIEAPITRPTEIDTYDYIKDEPVLTRNISQEVEIPLRLKRSSFREEAIGLNRAERQLMPLAAFSNGDGDEVHFTGFEVNDDSTFVDPTFGDSEVKNDKAILFEDIKTGNVSDLAEERQDVHQSEGLFSDVQARNNSAQDDEFSKNFLWSDAERIKAIARYLPRSCCGAMFFESDVNPVSCNVNYAYTSSCLPILRSNIFNPAKIFGILGLFLAGLTLFVIVRLTMSLIVLRSIYAQNRKNLLANPFFQYCYLSFFPRAVYDLRAEAIEILV